MMKAMPRAALLCADASVDASIIAHTRESFTTWPWPPEQDGHTMVLL